ncbi:MAG: S-layer homology domain-containing protein [Ruminococcaceae bacterium]|nr:S-layer homology domain-containing protein [Oscillospiraceae bacterium]
MKIKILSLCMAMLLCVFPLSVFAETEPEAPAFRDVVINYTRADGTITVTGKAPFALNMAEPVRLMLLKPDSVGGDTNLTKLINGTATFVEVGVHVDETMLLGDKSFAFTTFTLSDSLAAGDYTLRMVSENISYTAVIGVASIAQTVTAMNQVTEVEDIRSNIEKYNDVYQLEVGAESAYSKLSETGKSKVLSGLCNTTFADETEIKNTFDALVQLSRVSAGPWGVLEEIIENYSTLLELTPYMDDFNALNSTRKDLVYKALVGKSYQSISAFAETFDGAVTDAENAILYPNSEPSSDRGSGGVSSAVRVPVVSEPDDNKQPEQTNKIFRDLGNYAWAEESVLELYNKGIISGKAEGLFAPADSVTRGEAIKMIVLAFSQIDPSATCSFTDVPKDSWVYPYVATALKAQIVHGYNDSLAGAGDTITREDFATMILRAIQASNKSLTEATEAADFSDDGAIASYAKEAVYKLQRAGVIHGAGNNSFLPKNATTRAEAAKIIAALLD